MEGQDKACEGSFLGADGCRGRARARSGRSACPEDSVLGTEGSVEDRSMGRRGGRPGLAWLQLPRWPVSPSIISLTVQQAPP